MDSDAVFSLAAETVGVELGEELGLTVVAAFWVIFGEEVDETVTVSE